MAPKRRSASEFGVNYSPQRRRVEPAAVAVRVEVSTVWIRRPVGRLLTLQLKDSDTGDAFRHLIRDCKAIAPALTDRNARSSVMNGWKLAFGTHSSDYVHTLQIPTVPEEVCGWPPRERGEEKREQTEETRRGGKSREEKRKSKLREGQGQQKAQETREEKRREEKTRKRQRDRETDRLLLHRN